MSHPVPPNVLLVCGGFPLRSETFIRDHATGLIDAGCNVTVLALHPGDASPWDAHEQSVGLPNRVRTADINRPVSLRMALGLARAARLGCAAPRLAFRSIDPRLGWRAPSGQLLEAAAALGISGVPHRFDRIHAEFGPSGVVASVLLRAGLIAGPLSVAFYGYDTTRAVRSSRAGLYTDLFSDADLILPNSEYLAHQLRAIGAPPERLIVHRLGVDITRFTPSPSLPRADGAWTAVAIGRCVPKKGFATLIRAMALAGDDAPSLTLIGDGPLFGDLRELANELGVSRRIRFAGWCDRAEVAAELAQADALIAPSETAADGDIEGMPVVIMEAMATGLAILGTQHSGIPEIVRDGVNGFTVAERDAESLAQAMARLADPATRVRFGRASREIAVRELSHAMLIRRLVELLLDNRRIDL